MSWSSRGFNADQRSRDLWTSSLRHYAVQWAWVFLFFSSARMPLKKTYRNYLFCRLCSFSRSFNSNLFRIQIFGKTLIVGFEYWRIHYMHP